jgi:hypothetical protein
VKQSRGEAEKAERKTCFRAWTILKAPASTASTLGAKLKLGSHLTTRTNIELNYDGLLMEDVAWRGRWLARTREERRIRIKEDH